MIITIDGPAGAGKSSLARALAGRLGFHFLDTGAMYRAVALAAVRQGVALDDATAVAKLARRIKVEVSDRNVQLNGEDVTQDIRAMEITSVVHHVADNVAVREHLVQLQRRIGKNGNFVTEGRDQGTVVFPDAQRKIFLTASAQVRARRRMADLRARGANINFEEVLRQQNERDQRDRDRQVGRLVPATDAVQMCTDGLTPEQVVDHIERIVRPVLPTQGGV